MVLLLKTPSMQKVCTLGTLNFSLELLNIPHRGVDYFLKNVLSFVNIGVNNLRKNPVLQLKQSNLPLALYLLKKQFVREKHMLGHTCHGLDN